MADAPEQASIYTGDSTTTIPLVAAGYTIASSGAVGITLGGSVWHTTGQIKTVQDALETLVAAVEAGAPCRCFASEVCPMCHDLQVAVDHAKQILTSATPIAPASNSFTGTTTVSSGTLTLGEINVYK